MEIVRVKIGVCEYYFEFETLEDLKQHFKNNGMNSVAFHSFDRYDTSIKGKKIAVEALSIEDVRSVQRSDNMGYSSFLRGWGNKIKTKT